jgi:mono/diheme cytochrome c family protein
LGSLERPQLKDADWFSSGILPGINLRNQPFTQAENLLNMSSKHLVIHSLFLAASFLVPANTFAEVIDSAKHSEEMTKGLEVFKKHVRQILVEKCADCHGVKKVKGKLDLTRRKTLMRGGAEGAGIVPRDAKNSRLVRQIRHQEEPHMPHKAPKLSEVEIAHIVEWINLGAPYDKPLAEKVASSEPKAMTVSDSDRDFWSFRPLRKIELPKVKNKKWCRTPIDFFILRKLEEKGIQPNEPASRLKLLRRASFDLTGLPPTPEEIGAFLGDHSKDAWPKLLKRLLASQRLGERWARHWLDTARFAESHGFEHDYDRPFAFHYRDFVIKALNQDQSYDQFVKWQLAGDEFEPKNSLAMMATGFLGAGVFPTQITKNEVERTRYDALDDMAATMGTSMLGLTIGCARCHDHKFDPIPTNDYYRLLSTFTTTVRSNIDLDLTPASYKEAKAKFDKEHEPFVKALEKFEKEKLPARFDEWLATRPKDEKPKSPWMILDMVETKSREGATFTKQDDGSYLVTGKNARFDEYTFVAHTNLQGLTSIRLEPLAHKSMKRGGPGRAGNGNFALSDFRVTVAPLNGKAKPVGIKLKNPRASFNQGNHLHVKLTIDGNKSSSWAVDPQFGKDHAAVWDFETDVGFEGGTILTVTLLFNNNTSHNIGRPRVSISTQARPVPLKEKGAPQELVEIFSILDGEKKGELSVTQKQNLMRWYKRKDPEWLKLNQKVQEHLKGAPRPSVAKVMVASEGFKPLRHHTQGADFFKETFLLKRGDTDQKQGVANQSFLQVLMRGGKTEKDWLMEPPKGWRTSYRRKSLATWITDVENGAGNLLARVIVNRLWHHHFGKGIVRTPNDFGFQGDRPSHPALLEWLADDLVANGWKLKRLHQMIMNSSVYMESSTSSKEKIAADPGNKLRWRWERRRLESEAVRDTLLFVSGSLDERMYGKGTLNEGMTRRSIYFTVKRSRLIPTMVLFDFPESLSSIGERASTTIAPQALMLMNNPRIRTYSKSFAKRLGPLDKSNEDAVRNGYRLALGREPDDDELKRSQTFLDLQTQKYQKEGQSDSSGLALADFCQVLLSLNEFVYVE